MAITVEGGKAEGEEEEDEEEEEACDGASAAM
jgi:hypothetical protein